MGGGGASSITCRRRARLHPPSALVHTGQCLIGCSTIRVGSSRRRARLYLASHFLRGFLVSSGGLTTLAFTKAGGGVFCFSSSSMRLWAEALDACSVWYSACSALSCSNRCLSRSWIWLSCSA